MNIISIYLPASKLASRDLEQSDFFKKIKKSFKINLILETKSLKKLKSKNCFNKIHTLNNNKIRYLIWLSLHHLTRTRYEKKIFPSDVKNQSLGISTKILFILKLIIFLKIDPIVNYFLKFILVKTCKIDFNLFKDSDLLILFGSSKDIFFDDLIRICKRSNLKSTLITTNWDNATTKPYIEKPDEVWTWGNQTAKLSKKFHAIKSYPVGTPRFDKYKNFKLSKFSSKLKLGLKNRYKYILFSGSAFPFAETETLLLMVNYLQKKKYNNIKIIYRPHPYTMVNHLKSIKENQTLNKIIIDPTLNIFKKKTFMQYPYLLNSVSALVCPSSTLLVEALRYNVPTMCVAFNLEKYRLFNWNYNTKYQPHFGIFRENKKTYFCWKIERFDNVFKKLIRDMLSKKKKNNNEIFNSIVFDNKNDFSEIVKKNIRRILA
jgi:hypothetical protein